MLLISFITIALLSISYILKRLRTAESLLLMPFAAGSMLLPAFSTVPFYQLRIGHVVLALFLIFEWLLLTGLGMILTRSRRRPPRCTSRIPLSCYEPPIRWLALLLILSLATYIVAVVGQVAAAPSISEHFLSKRAEAHAGEGVDISNPLAYRAINFSMALVLLMTAWRHFVRHQTISLNRVTFLTLLLAGSIASLLEGNRSTLIVTLLGLMCFVYVNRRSTTKSMVISLIAFVMFFVISMQVLRLEGDFSLEGMRVAFSWFSVYAFGSAASFADFFDQRIPTYWYTFDIAAYKFDDRFAQAIGAREFFLIDYVDVGDLSTNVYSGYAVLYDYLRFWAAPFLVAKTAVFYFFEWAGRQTFVGKACYIVLLASYPLTIYHEFFLTSLYYCLVIVELAVVTWLLAYVVWLARTHAPKRYRIGAKPNWGH